MLCRYYCRARPRFSDLSSLLNFWRAAYSYKYFNTDRIRPGPVDEKSLFDHPPAPLRQRHSSYRYYRRSEHSPNFRFRSIHTHTISVADATSVHSNCHTARPPVRTARAFISSTSKRADRLIGLHCLAALLFTITVRIIIRIFAAIRVVFAVLSPRRPRAPTPRARRVSSSRKNRAENRHRRVI